MTSQVLIVGAGPAGSMAAIRLAQQGVKDVLLIDRAQFPHTKPCASGLGPNALKVLDEVGMGARARQLGYPMQSLRLFTPGRREMRVNSQGAAVVLARRVFDQLLVDQAKEQGVEFRDGVPASSLVREGGRVVGVRAGAEELRARVVLVAGGANCSFSPDRRPRALICTLMGWWEGFPVEPGTMEMMFDRRLRPLYGWMFPESDSRVNIGPCVDSTDLFGRPRPRQLHIRELFQAFLDDYFADRLRHARQIGKLQGHPISHSVWVRDCAVPGALFLGEGARLVHNVTGEGIFQAMQSGLWAADAARQVLIEGRDEHSAWRRYTWKLRARFTPGFALGYGVRAALPVPTLDLVARLHGSERLRRLASTFVGSALAGAKLHERAAVEADIIPESRSQP
jgi:geranylgeranyl reductase family protein